MVTLACVFRALSSPPPLVPGSQSFRVLHDRRRVPADRRHAAPARCPAPRASDGRRVAALFAGGGYLPTGSAPPPAVDMTQLRVVLCVVGRGKRGTRLAMRLLCIYFPSCPVPRLRSAGHHLFRGTMTWKLPTTVHQLRVLAARRNLACPTRKRPRRHQCVPLRTRRRGCWRGHTARRTPSRRSGDCRVSWRTCCGTLAVRPSASSQLSVRCDNSVTGGRKGAERLRGQRGACSS